MGFYATTTSLATCIPDFSDDITATTALFDQCISDAEAECNKYLSRRYDLTVWQTSAAAVPPMLRSLSLKLAEGYFWQRASRGAKESLARGSNLEKNALVNLKDIAEYKANLVDTAGAAIVGADDQDFRVLCNTSDYTPTFNERSSLSWRKDRDKNDDEDM